MMYKNAFVIVQALFYLIIFSFLAQYLQGSVFSSTTHQKTFLYQEILEEGFLSAYSYAQDHPDISCQNSASYEQYFSKEGRQILLSCQAIDLTQSPGLYALELTGTYGQVGHLGYHQRKEQWYSFFPNS